MKIKKGDDLVMMVKDSRIVLEESDVELLLDGEFKGVKAITEEGLKKLWFKSG